MFRTKVNTVEFHGLFSEMYTQPLLPKTKEPSDQEKKTNEEVENAMTLEEAQNNIAEALKSSSEIMTGLKTIKRTLELKERSEANTQLNELEKIVTKYCSLIKNISRSQCSNEQMGELDTFTWTITGLFEKDLNDEIINKTKILVGKATEESYKLFFVPAREYLTEEGREEQERLERNFRSGKTL